MVYSGLTVSEARCPGVVDREVEVTAVERMPVAEWL